MMTAPRENPEPVEQVYYTAGDWKKVAHGLHTRYAVGELPKQIGDFSQHIWDKASGAEKHKGSDFVLGETLTSSDARVVRESADNRGVKDVKGRIGS